MTTVSATRTACFRPDEYRDLQLFANRSELLHDLREAIASYIKPGAPGEARVLICGQRGVGKSMLTRKALADVCQEHSVLTVTADGWLAGQEPVKFLRKLARELARETLEHALDDDLRKSAEFLLRLSSVTEVTVKEAQTWARAINLGVKLTHRFQDAVGFEFGWRRSANKTRTVEETHKRTMDADFLRELIQNLVADCHKETQPVLLFLDNLDQVGYSGTQDGAQQVTDLARYLLGLERCVVVVNLRSEFVSADLRRLNSLTFEVEGLQPDELMEIYHQRVEARGGDAAETLASVGFQDIASSLARRTDNGWAYLSWLAFLDQQRINFAADDSAALDKLMERFARQSGAGVSMDEMQRLASPYRDHGPGFLTRAQLSAHGVADELLQRATHYGVLVPDYLLSPDRFLLSPTLSFLLTGTPAQ